MWEKLAAEAGTARTGTASPVPFDSSMDQACQAAESELPVGPLNFRTLEPTIVLPSQLHGKTRPPLRLHPADRPLPRLGGGVRGREDARAGDVTPGATADIPAPSVKSRRRIPQGMFP